MRFVRVASTQAQVPAMRSLGLVVQTTKECVCQECAEPIGAGETTRYIKDVGYAHLECDEREMTPEEQRNFVEWMFSELSEAKDRHPSGKK